MRHYCIRYEKRKIIRNFNLTWNLIQFGVKKERIIEGEGRLIQEKDDQEETNILNLLFFSLWLQPCHAFLAFIFYFNYFCILL